MKKILKITMAVAAVGMALTIAGCDGCSSCSGCSNTSINKTVTRSNWFTSINVNGIQPSFTEGDENFSKEEIVYDVSYISGDLKNSTYSVEYADGTYVTEFYATSYNWNNENIPESYRSNLAETVYYYKTQLSISVKFTMKSGESSEWFNDSVVTESYFRSAKNNLQPIYSKQVLKTTSPAKLNAASLTDAYSKVDVTYENFYNRSCTEITSYDSTKDEPVKYSLKNVKNSLFDNSSVYIAARGLKLTESDILTVNQNVNVFSAADGKVCDYTFVGGIGSLNSTDKPDARKTITAALQDKGLYIPKTLTNENGEPVADPGVSSVVVAINNVSGVLTSSAQYVWYAAVDNEDNNVSRGTMLRMLVPLGYNLGSMNYTLKEVKSTLWNG